MFETGEQASGVIFSPFSLEFSCHSRATYSKLSMMGKPDSSRFSFSAASCRAALTSLRLSLGSRPLARNSGVFRIGQASCWVNAQRQRFPLAINAVIKSPSHSTVGFDQQIKTTAVIQASVLGGRLGVAKCSVGKYMFCHAEHLDLQ